MDNTPSFYKSFLPPAMSVLNSEHWDTVMKLYDEKKFRQVVYGVLEYVKKGLSEEALNTAKTVYAFPHGSVIVNLEIKEDMLYVSAPFLRIPAKYLIPLMRQVTELNFGTLVLAQIRLEDNDIYFRYECPLELCHPYKLYRVLEEICIQADANDDMFIEKFGAQRFSEMKVEPFDSLQISEAWDRTQQFLQEAFDYADYFQSKRIEYFGWDAFYLAFTRIDHFARPQGLVKAEIEKAMRDLNSGTDTNAKLAKARKNAQQLLDMGKDKFAESLYKTEQFVSEKPTFDSTGIKNYLNKPYSTAQGEMDKKDFLGASLTMLTGFYGLFFYYLIPQQHYDIILKSLEESGNKPWAEAANTLWTAYQDVMTAKDDESRNNIREISRF